jgi:hypothetical protein
MIRDILTPTVRISGVEAKDHRVRVRRLSHPGAKARAHRVRVRRLKTIGFDGLYSEHPCSDMFDVDYSVSDILMFIFLIRNVVSLQTHNRVKRQLAQLLKKHAQFQTVLDANNTVQSSIQTDVN